MRLAFLAVLLVAACSADPGRTPTSASDTGSDTVTVEAVIDGDTFESGARRYRLDGVNAPDRGECGYDEARDWLADGIEGTTVDVGVTGTDQFDRSLVQVHSDGVWLNLALVSAGLAIATSAGEDHTLLEAEEQAYAERIGLWAPDACDAHGPIPLIRVVDLSFDPPGPDEEDLAGERVVLANESDTPVDVAGWRIRDESSLHRFTFPPGTVLAPGETVTVTSADPGWVPGHSPVWNNGGDVVLVIDSFGRVVDRYRY